jgi:predicted N-acetyltransferase YhbS/nitroimidazol reductase NimA-like FMN-containing flavoprotein (pyridoxamine 5'-phosphate oxidase superfamily)
MQASATDPRELKRALFRRDEAHAWQLFDRAPCVRFAAVRADGTPLLRSFTAVVVDGRLCFHGADAGEKREIVGQRAVASADEIVAQVSSHWIHPELACPASTYFMSALAEGTVEAVVDLERRARILSALMRRFQPEGGYAPITPHDKRYRKVLEELFVAELVPVHVSAKFRLGQHRTRSQIEGVLTGLWQRGEAGDLRAIRLIQQAHPERPQPAFLRAPEGTVLCVSPDAGDASAVAELLSNQYWTHEFSPSVMARAHLGSQAWVVARDSAGKLIGSARAVSDAGRFAWILDVIVDHGQRGKGIGQALMRLILDHPVLRRLAYIGLRTRDAHGLYTKFGFVSEPGSPVQMGLKRGQP